MTAAAAAPQRRAARARWILLLLAGLAVAAGLSLAIGARSVPLAEILSALGGARDSVGEAAVALRIPRTLLAAAAGAALALAGAVMQGVTRNPLADPGILGVNAGAAFAVVAGIAFFGLSSVSAYVLCAILGAGAAAAAVYAIGGIGAGGATPLKLALTGTAVAIALSSLTTAIVLPRGDIAGTARSWQTGGVGGAGYDSLRLGLPVLALGAALCLGAARGLNMLGLGEETAKGLGSRVAATRALASLGAVMLCGTATALCGPIGFVGLVVPHACRLLCGADHRWLLPFSAIGGAILLILADIAGRVAMRPAEMDVGIVTAFLGAPVFIWIVRRRRAGALAQ
ncbi:iron ABC transporter permease [Poseidonocella sp. HB161398]|uniref:FecCD family ABC transporter permease n=1 Tax=Poseidonocella sp. HB161398 TaxID=2320855 RepID=UPI00110944E3|nr:iron ABC transporter permease [Poseidonocella sp. HB161398]